MGKRLIIKGADFSQNCIGSHETDEQKFRRYISKLVYMTNLNVTAGSPGYKTYLGVPNTANSRRAIAVPDTEVDAQDIYNNFNESQYVDCTVSPLNDSYTFLPIPPSIKTVTFGFSNPSYYVGSILISAANNKIIDSGWKQGGSTYTFDLTNYNQVLWMAFNSKKSSGVFTNMETLADVGFSINFTV